MKPKLDRDTEPTTLDSIAVQEDQLSEGLNDGNLIGACISGDERAWEQMLTRYGRLIYSIPLRMGFSTSATEEIYQEVCLILLEKLDTFRNQSQLSTWLYTVTRRACLQRWRQRKAMADFDELETISTDEASLEEQLVLVEQQEMVRKALESLDQRCRTLLHALFFETTSPAYTVLAGELDVPVGSIGPIRARCLEKLKQVLIKLDAGEHN